MLSVAIRDMAALERVYRTVVAARPTAIGGIYFELDPGNATKTWLATEAVRDAARRARQAAEASGSRLGAAKIVDPSGGVCQTQVLAGWPSYVGGKLATDVTRPAGLNDEISVTAARAAPAPPPPPPPGLDAQAADVQVTLQPPLRQLEDRACVIYALLP